MHCIALNSRLPEFHISCGLLRPRNILIIKEYSFEGFENHSVVVNSVFIAFEKHCEQMSWMGSRFTFWLSRSVKVDFGLLVYFLYCILCSRPPTACKNKQWQYNILTWRNFIDIVCIVNSWTGLIACLVVTWLEFSVDALIVGTIDMEATGSICTAPTFTVMLNSEKLVAFLASCFCTSTN